MAVTCEPRTVTSLFQAQQVDPLLREFVNRYMTLKAITERSHAMFDASAMPTCYNVWRYS